MLGFTYNFENEHTQYQNGVDMHLDWGASKFVSTEVLLGLVGYAYQQISCDSGAGDRVGCFKSRVFGAGPQIGVIIPMATTAGLPEPERVQGVRSGAPPVRLEYLAHLCDLAGPADAERAAAAAQDQEVVAGIRWFLAMQKAAPPRMRTLLPSKLDSRVTGGPCD